eukprot:CAMPEP_0175459732 /NCGR_PEP_ID=MMETSP0095-20121207/67275_1 /TAXON_ID=311494 /ORGANISM="Alexandrium monilatum, Strain CCMP3105" /LENGTH=33 /DNA_ID= /DNA_START= /DNA_END= /DNA_ORIENTATION=
MVPSSGARVASAHEEVAQAPLLERLRGGRLRHG